MTVPPGQFVTAHLFRGLLGKDLRTGLCKGYVS